MNHADAGPRVCVLGATFETSNLGVSALTAGTIQCILEQWPQAEIFLLNYRKTPCTYTLQLANRQVAVPLVNMRFSWRFWLGNNIAFLLFLTTLMKLIPAGLRRRWIARSTCLSHLAGADLVVAISGGDSFSDIYGLSRLFYVSLPQLLALGAGKRLILLPQTLGPFRGGLARKIAKFILKRAEVIYSRDHAGMTQLEDWLGHDSSSGRVKFCYDVGFVVDPIPPPEVDCVGLSEAQLQVRRPVGLNISGLLDAGGYTRNNMFGLKTDYRAFNLALIDFLITKKNVDVVLIPHVLGKSPESDVTVCERVYDELKARYPGRLGLVRGRYNQSEIKDVIGRCEFFIGARMHACIAALSQAIPAVAIAYSDKFIGVLRTIEVGGLVADPRSMDEKEMLDAIGEAFDRRATLRRQLEETIPGVKQAVLNLFKHTAPTRPTQGAPVTAGQARHGIEKGAGLEV